MTKPLDPKLLPRNLETYHRHRREVLWQIGFPVGILAVILLVLALLATQASSGQASLWADISVIWLIIPALVIALLITIFLAAGVYLTVQLIRWLPVYSYRALLWLWNFDSRTKKLSDSAVAPILRFQSFKASLRALGRQGKRR